MSFSRFVVAGLLVTAFAAVAGCSESSTKDEEDVAATESELKLSGTRYLGKIKNGETRTGYYKAPPTYRSYGFDAKGGDEITIDVKSVYGDGMGWITDSSYKVLAFNDDATGSTLDAKVKYKVPAGQAARSYRIVFRDYDMLEATFNVTLSITSTAPSTCSYGGQTYQQGDRFESSDGCNTCSCLPDGSVACTEMACTCNPAAEPHRNYVGTPQQCMVIRYSCPSGQSHFSNSCGCGCEPTK
jgi:Pacifastin inhibitor (LCMII)